MQKRIIEFFDKLMFLLTEHIKILEQEILHYKFIFNGKSF